MPAKSLEEICDLFKQYKREGDIDAVLILYDADIIFERIGRNEKREGSEGRTCSSRKRSYSI